MVFGVVHPQSLLTLPHSPKGCKRTAVMLSLQPCIPLYCCSPGGRLISMSNSQCDIYGSYLKVTLESRVTSQNARLVESKFFKKDCLILSSLMSISHLFFSGPRVFRQLISSRHDSLPFSAFQTISEVWYLNAAQSPLTSQHHRLLLLYSNLLLILLLITNV